jgi:TetR/AcrR family transcriptional regulator, repressor for uid operon
MATTRTSQPATQAPPRSRRPPRRGPAPARAPGASAPAPGEDPLTAQITDAALEQFADLGIRRSSMDDVARRAGVSRMTVFRRFGSKDRLVQSVLEREIQRAWAELEEIWATTDTTEQRLLEAFVYAVRFIRDHPVYDRLIRSEPETLLALLTIDGDPVLSLYRSTATRWLQDEMDHGHIAPADPATAAEIIARLALSLVLTPGTISPQNDRQHLANIVRMLMPSLSPAPARQTAPRARKRQPRQTTRPQ